jgi:hypothetical protein
LICRPFRPSAIRRGISLALKSTKLERKAETKRTENWKEKRQKAVT